MVVRVGRSSPWLAAREERGEDKIEQECAAREEDKVGGKRGQAPQGHASSEGGGLRDRKNKNVRLEKKIRLGENVGRPHRGHASSEGGGLREEKISRSKVNVFHIYRQGEG